MIHTCKKCGKNILDEEYVRIHEPSKTSCLFGDCYDEITIGFRCSECGEERLFEDDKNEV